MPSPVAHSLVGLGGFLVAQFGQRSGTVKGLVLHRWKEIIFFVILANAPDLDILFGLLIKGDAQYYHSQFTHSILAAFCGAMVVAMIFNIRRFQWTFLVGFSMMIAHDLMDCFSSCDMKCKGFGVQLFYPVKKFVSLGPIFYGFKHQNLQQLFCIYNVKVVLREIAIWGTADMILLLFLKTWIIMRLRHPDDGAS